MNHFGRFVLVIVLLGLILTSLFFSKYILLANGYNAKMLCSCVFMSERDNCLSEDLGDFSYLNRKTNKEKQYVTSNFFGILEKKALYRKGLGCTLVDDGYDLKKPKRVIYSKPDFLKVEPWPFGDRVDTEDQMLNVDYEKLHIALDSAFSEPYAGMKRGTRAVVVVYKDKIISERYAEGFNKDTRMLSWSMTKSLINALAGVMVKDGIINLHDRLELEEWKEDSRKNITVDQLLRMSSGLHFEEEYAKPSTATNMLFNSYSAAHIGIKQKAKYRPDEKWHYSSGTTNILTKFLMDKLQEKDKNPIDYIYNRLFNKLGMYSMVMEVDASGYFVGSSYSYATPRDWARFGLFYLHKGVWNNEQILPADWVRYTRTPTLKSDSGMYGAHFWLNSGLKPDHSDRTWPNLPEDIFYAAGYQGQFVFIIPSMDLVIVRMGQYSDRKAWDSESFLENILRAFPEQNQSVLLNVP